MDLMIKPEEISSDFKRTKELAMKWASYFPDKQPCLHEPVKFIYSKSQLHIWQVESWISDQFKPHDAIVLVSRWPTGSDKKGYNLKDLDKEFYTIWEYKRFYNDHKNMLCDMPVPPSKFESENNDEDETYDKVLEFVQLVDEDKYLYKFSYTLREDDSRHEKFMKLSIDDIHECETNKNVFMNTLFGVVKYMEKPVDEWNGISHGII